MKKNKLLQGFFATLFFAILIRLFVVDVISISSEILEPDFFPGDFLLISKLSNVYPGQWVLLRDYPQKSVYSIRKLGEKSNNQDWFVMEPFSSANPNEERPLIENSRIVGKVVLVLWSLPCKPSALAAGFCTNKKYRYFKFID